MKCVLSAIVMIGMLALPLLFPLPTSAVETNLSSSVPKQVTLSIEIDGKGTATLNGQSITKQTKILVDRLENVNVCIAAHSAYSLESVHLDGVDVTDGLKDGLLAIESIRFDTFLAIKFAPKEPGQSEVVPATGDTSHLYMMVLCWFGSLIMLIILFCSKQIIKE